MTSHEQHCLDNAASFSAARGRGFSRTVHYFATMEAAKEYASTFGDGRTMIYAVTADGSGAHITNA